MSRSEIYEMHPLFEDVQLNRIFADGKTFVDCLPREPVEAINEKYIRLKDQPGFDLAVFIEEHFERPPVHSTAHRSDKRKTVEENIELLWKALSRQPDKEGGSLIPLPFPYIVPGGRFGEIYYWDSYFTMLGLLACGQAEMLENMVSNFSYLINTYGFIPNGNRTYYLSRSQPPFYSLMIKLLAAVKGKQALLDALPFLQMEYDYWMKGASELTPDNPARYHCIRMPDGEWLNRYWDEKDTPRPESFREDVELAGQSAQEPSFLYRHLRAGAASGWDYSSRWFKEPGSFASIHTTDIVPVDLNCLLFHLEETLAEVYQLSGHTQASAACRLKADERKKAIQKYCWNSGAGFYVDYDATAQKQKKQLSLAGLYPMFFNMADKEQAEKTAGMVKEKFLKPGGVVSTLEQTGQQWDAPNGWAPLQWITIQALENYQYHELAAETARRWIRLNREVFSRTGKLMEKYNVVDVHLEAGGGEYAGQDGFGWTNGVLIALIKKYGG